MDALKVLFLEKSKESIAITDTAKFILLDSCKLLGVEADEETDVLDTHSCNMLQGRETD